MEEIHENMVEILAENRPSYTTVKKWAVKFKWSRDSTEDDPRSSCQKTSIIDGQVDVYYMIWDDRHLTVQQIAKSIGISSGSIHTILTEILEIS